MERHLFGQACSLLTAILWAFAVVMFKRTGEKVSPLALNLFKNVIGLALLAATLVATGQGFSVLQDHRREDIYILLLSGFLGIAVADTLFFYSLNLVGVGLMSIVDCLYSPVIILFSFLFLSEQLTATHYVGAALIVTGVLVSSNHPPPPGKTRGQLLMGILVGALAISTMGLGIVMAKPVLDGMDFPLVWATSLRLFAGLVPLVLWLAASPNRREHYAVFRPAAVWKYSVPGSVLGTYVCLLLWVAGFKYTHASIASVLNQTSTIFAFILATLILKERFSGRKFCAAVLALTGVLLITLHKYIVLP